MFSLPFRRLWIKRAVVILLFSSFVGVANSQVLISLLFGEYLNSGKVEFGLDGGMNYSTIQNLDGAKFENYFNIGFYFDIKLKNPQWMVCTGVLVKATSGASGMDVYSTGDKNIDSTFSGGSMQRNLGYFNVPILMKYRFKNGFFVKAGPMLSLLNKGNDVFSKEISGNELECKIENRDLYHRIDAGALVGIGYKLLNKKGDNGMSFGVNYYQGLLDVLKENSGDPLYNQSIFLSVCIPIGRADTYASK